MLTNGYISLNNLIPGTQVLDINSVSAQDSPAGGPYAGFREQFPLIAHVENIVERPFFLPRIAVNSLTTIDPNQETVVSNDDLGVSLTIPAHTAKNPDGTDFTGAISISLVPEGLAPAVLPGELLFGQLVTIQRVGITFTTPVPLTFPNTDNLAPDNEVEIWSVDPEMGAFVVVGIGEVSADGQSINTISGGITATDWHCMLTPELDNANQSENPNCNQSCKNQQATNSSLTTQSGELSTTFKLPDYFSQGQGRGLSFMYESRRALPTPLFRWMPPSIDVQRYPLKSLIRQLSVALNKIIGYTSQLKG